MEVSKCGERRYVSIAADNQDIALQKQKIRLENFKKHLGGIKSRLRQVTSGANTDTGVQKVQTDDKENHVGHSSSVQLAQQVKSTGCSFPIFIDKGCSAKNLQSVSQDNLALGPIDLHNQSSMPTFPDGAFSFRTVQKGESVAACSQLDASKQLETTDPSNPERSKELSSRYSRNQAQPERLKPNKDGQIFHKSAAELPNEFLTALSIIQEEALGLPKCGSPVVLKFSPIKPLFVKSKSGKNLNLLQNHLAVVSGICSASSPNFNLLEGSSTRTGNAVSLSEAFSRTKLGIVKKMIRPRSNPPNLFGEVPTEPQEGKDDVASKNPQKSRESLHKAGLRTSLHHKSQKSPSKHLHTKSKDETSSVNTKPADHQQGSASSSAMITPSFRRSRQKSVEPRELGGTRINRKLFSKNSSIEEKLDSMKPKSRERIFHDPLRHKPVVSPLAAGSVSKLLATDRSRRTAGLGLMKKRLNQSGVDSQHDTSCKLNQSSINTSRLELKLSESKDKPPSIIQSGLIQRLAKGARAQVPGNEMKDRTKRLYEELPEVKAKRQQERVRETSAQRVQRIKAYDSVA